MAAKSPARGVAEKDENGKYVRVLSKYAYTECSLTQLRPPESMVSDFFERYDLDHSGTMNSKEELRQLATNLIVKCAIRMKVYRVEGHTTHLICFVAC